MNKSLSKSKALDYTFLLLIIGLAVLFIPKSGVTTSGDTESYVFYALKLLNGDGLVCLNRGPLFPIFIALSFCLFGTSIKSGFLMVRFFFGLNIVLSYLLGKVIYNRWIGLSFAFFVLSSYGINLSAGFFLADTMTPFFLLLYLLLLYKGIVTHKSLFFIMAGIAIGFEFLTHEYFVPFFLLLPFLLVGPFKQFRNKQYWYRIGILNLCFLLTIMPWVIYVFSHGGNFSTLLGKAAGEAAINVPNSYHQLISQFSVISSLIFEVDYFNALHHLYIAKLHKYFVLAPLLVGSLMVLLVKNLTRRDLGDIFILFAILVLFPIMIAVGHKSYRIGGAVIFFFLLYLVFSKVLFEGALWVSKMVDQ